MNVQLPDNSVVQFPDEMPPEQVNAAITNYLGQPATPSPSTGSPVDTSMPGEDAFRQLGLTGRYMVEGPASLLTVPGDLANMAVNAASPSVNKSLGTNIPQLEMPSDKLSEALTNLGYPEPQGGKEKAVAFASKLATGLMPAGESLMGAGKEIASNLGDMLAKSDVPTSSQAVKQIANQYYQQAADTGGVLKPSFTDEFVNKISDLAPQTEQGKIFAGDTPLTQLVDRAQALRGQPLSLPAVQEIDEHLGNLADSEYGLKGLSKEGKQYLDVQSTLRNMINDAGPDDVVGGTQGFDALSNGRQAWSQAMKMQDIERIQARAAQSDNPATTIKSGVRTLLSNPSRTRGYSEEELDALNNAGDRGVVGGTLHVMGSRLVPYLGALIGEHAGGPVGAMGGLALGQGGSSLLRAGATAIQSKKLGDVLKTMGQNVGGE